jgi:hypothetical protein
MKRLRVFLRRRRSSQRPRPIDSEELLRIYRETHRETHRGVEDLRRAA